MNFQQIITELQSKKYHPVYFLYGDEPYFIDEITQYIEKNILDKAEKEFNQTILYGKDIEALALISEARRYPMMAEKTVVIVKEAQDLKQFEALESYFEQPSPTTILVLAYKKDKMDKRKKVFKALSKNALVFESKKLYENQLPDWISNYLKSKNYSIAPKAAAMLTEFLGQELDKIVNALNKLCILYPAGTNFLPEDIEKNIGISKEYNVFEYTKALGFKDSLKSFRIAKYFEENEKKNHPTMIIPGMFRYFSQLMIYHSTRNLGKNIASGKMGINPYFYTEFEKAGRNYTMTNLADIVAILREYDLKSKGMGATANNKNLITELTYKILA